jgi:hypothetical protein
VKVFKIEHPAHTHALKITATPSPWSLQNNALAQTQPAAMQRSALSHSCSALHCAADPPSSLGKATLQMPAQWRGSRATNRPRRIMRGWIASMPYDFYGR